VGVVVLGCLEEIRRKKSRRTSRFAKIVMDVMRASRGGISQDDMISFGFLGAIIRNWKEIEIAVAVNYFTRQFIWILNILL
jgi:hypothetical protein